MPEGDTIFRSASRLRRVMDLRTVELARCRDANLDVDALVGCQVASVEARGKHLLMHFIDGRVVHSHMGMTGSWHIYAVGEPWRKPERQAALVLQMSAASEVPAEQTGHVVVCFNPKLLEVLSAVELRRHTWLSRLGPDILANNFNCSAVIQRTRVHDRTSIGEVVMNQSILCGIGNVYKSETLFLCGVHPLTTVADMPDEQLKGIIDKARSLMKRNLEGYPRRTRDALGGRRLWVYNRAGKPCYKCRTPIVMRRQGDLGRSTYWCPKCQPQGA